MVTMLYRQNVKMLQHHLNLLHPMIININSFIPHCYHFTSLFCGISAAVDCAVFALCLLPILLCCDCNFILSLLLLCNELYASNRVALLYLLLIASSPSSQ